MEWKDSVTLVLPLVHVVTKNLTQLVNRENVSSPIAMAINEQLKRFADYNAHSGECSLYPAIRDLLMNFTLPLPNEIPLQAQQMQNQIVSPVGPIGSSPVGQMIHSPMQMNQNAPPTQFPN